MKKTKAVTEYKAPLAEKPPTRPKSPISYILEQQKLRTRQDLYKLRVAVDAAENVTNHNRELLHDIFREIILDPNLASNWESRKMKVKTKPFKVCQHSDEQEKEDKEATKVLQSPWFRQWMDACLDAELWGFTLVEFGPLDTSTGEFKPYIVNKKYYDAVTVIDRDNVKPELAIITKTPGESTGVSFFDPSYADYLMFVGTMTPNFFGVLGKSAKYCLFKDNAMGNWSEWAEVFGMDKRIGYTDSDGTARKEFMKALQDIGSNAYGVFTTRDRIEYLGTTRTDAFGVYKEFIRLIDEQISKIIFGQDVVSNNTGKVVGSVGENIANMYGDSDSLFIESLVNRRLFPLMANLGYTAFDGKYFKWDTSEKLGLVERAAVDKQIFDMGKEHSDEYINNTYGTEVIKKEPIELMEPNEFGKPKPKPKPEPPTKPKGY